MTSPVPHRNRSPYGWWVASYIERLEWKHEDRNNPRRRCLSWENTILVQASNRSQAWQKAVALGRLSVGQEVHDGKGHTGVWRYEGLTDLLPVYDRLEHGAEILWQEHKGRSVARVKAMVKKKNELGIFNDRRPRQKSGKAKA